MSASVCLGPLVSLTWSPRQIITDLEMMMIERLKLYQNQNHGKLPERILVYRNGISEVCRTYSFVRCNRPKRLHRLCTTPCCLRKFPG